MALSRIVGIIRENSRIIPERYQKKFKSRRGLAAHVGFPPPNPRGGSGQGGGACGGSVTSLRPPLYKEKRPHLLIDPPWLFASLPLPHSRAVPEFWSLHIWLEISTMHTSSCCWILGPDHLLLLFHQTEARGMLSTPYACRTTEVLPVVALHLLYVYSTLRQVSPYTFINNVTLKM
jgi:hypothetical protein